MKTRNTFLHICLRERLVLLFKTCFILWSWFNTYVLWHLLEVHSNCGPAWFANICWPSLMIGDTSCWCPKFCPQLLLIWFAAASFKGFRAAALTIPLPPCLLMLCCVWRPASWIGEVQQPFPPLLQELLQSPSGWLGHFHQPLQQGPSGWLGSFSKTWRGLVFSASITFRSAFFGRGTKTVCWQ